MVETMEADLLALLKGQIDTLDKAIARTIAADEALCRKAALLRSIQALGAVLSATLITEMPELGSLTHGQAASVVCFPIKLGQFSLPLASLEREN